jgi:hypothetical protein
MRVLPILCNPLLCARTGEGSHLRGATVPSETSRIIAAAACWVRTYERGREKHTRLCETLMSDRGGGYWVEPTMGNMGRYIMITMGPTRIPIARKGTGSIHVQANPLCCEARDGGRNTRVEMRVPTVHPTASRSWEQVSPPRVMPNFVLVHGDGVGRTGCCARRVLVHALTDFHELFGLCLRLLSPAELAQPLRTRCLQSHTDFFLP